MLATVIALYNRRARRDSPWGKEVTLMKRIMLLTAVALVMAAMVLAMAMPALAQSPVYACTDADTGRFFLLSPQQFGFVQQFERSGEGTCVLVRHVGPLPL
jgi:hypothetical protein